MIQNKKEKTFIVGFIILIFVIMISLALNQRSTAVETATRSGVEVTDTDWKLFRGWLYCPRATVAYSYTGTLRDGTPTQGSYCCQVWSGGCLPLQW